MKTQEILSIVALSLLGLCFLCGLAKMAMKKDSDKKNCDKACSMAIFAAVALVGVSQLLTETEKYTCPAPAGWETCGHGGEGAGGQTVCILNGESTHQRGCIVDSHPSCSPGASCCCP